MQFKCFYNIYLFFLLCSFFIEVNYLRDFYPRKKINAERSISINEGICVYYIHYDIIRSNY